MSQLIEFLMTLVGNKRFVDLMRQAVPRLIYITLGASARHAHRHFLSEHKAWSSAQTNVLAASAVYSLPPAPCHTAAVTTSCCKPTAGSFSRFSHKAEWPAGSMQQYSSLGSSQSNLPRLGAVCGADYTMNFRLSLSAVQAAGLQWQRRL